MANLDATDPVFQAAMLQVVANLVAPQFEPFSGTPEQKQRQVLHRAVLIQRLTKWSLDLMERDDHKMTFEDLGELVFPAPDQAH